MVNIKRPSWLTFWMVAAAALVSCAESIPVPTATVVAPTAQVPTATVVAPTAQVPTAVAVAPAPKVPVGPPPDIPSALLSTGSEIPDFGSYGGLRSLEDNILYADVIARVALLSTATSTAPITIGTRQRTIWLSLLEFKFTVNEYLKGSGGNAISGFVYMSYGTEAEARAAAEVMADAHDDRWDDREGIVFLSSSEPWIESSYQLDVGKYWFTRMLATTMDTGPTDGYTLASIHSKLWLPADESSGGVQGRASNTEKTFLLDVPAGTQVRGASVVRDPSAPPPDPPPASEITLSSLKRKITTLEAEANAGGTDAYYECVRTVYRTENLLRYFFLRHGSPVVEKSSTIGSGLPGGTLVSDYFRYMQAPSRTVAAEMVWLEGATKDLVRFENVDFRASGGVLGFTSRIVAARPLPASTYRFYPHRTSDGGVVCRKPNTAQDQDRYVLDVTVTSPSGVLHEAFFDPVTIGNAVGADGTNGVIKPADFVLNGTNTTISSLRWEDGAVTMTLSPSASLAGHAIDFIALDGSVSLTLSFDDATQGGSGALTWSVASQPWNDGDLLMLRIRPTNVIITPPTATPTPTPTAAPTATPTPTPTPAATPTPTPMATPTPTPTPTPTSTPTPMTTEPITVTLIPRVDGLTFFDIDIQWNYSGSCENYFVAITTATNYQISFLGFHPPETSSHYVEGGWLYDNVPDFWVVVECRASGDSQEVGRASLRAAHPDNN